MATKCFLALFLLAAFALANDTTDPGCSNCLFNYHTSTTTTLPIYCVPVGGGSPVQCGIVNAWEDSSQNLYFKIIASSTWCWDDAALWLSADPPIDSDGKRLPLEQWPFFVSGNGQCKTELDITLNIVDIDDADVLCDQTIWFSLSVNGWKDKNTTDPTCHPVQVTGCPKGDHQFGNPPAECSAFNCWYTEFTMCKEYCPECELPPTFPGVAIEAFGEFDISVPLVIEDNFLKDFHDISCGNSETFTFSEWDHVGRFIIDGNNLPNAKECWEMPGTILLSSCAYQAPNRILVDLIPPGTSPDDICEIIPGSNTECGFNYEPCFDNSWTFEYAPPAGNATAASYIVYFFTNEVITDSFLELYCVYIGGSGSGSGLSHTLSLNN